MEQVASFRAGKNLGFFYKKMLVLKVFFTFLGVLGFNLQNAGHKLRPTSKDSAT